MKEKIIYMTILKNYQKVKLKHIYTGILQSIHIMKIHMNGNTVMVIYIITE